VRRKIILVTGGAGLLGSKLVLSLLNKDYEVRVLDTRYGALEDVKASANLEFFGIGADKLCEGMLDKQTVHEAVKGSSVVFHLAINWNGATWKHELPMAKLFESNIAGTLNVLEASKDCGVKHLLFSSSAAVYGDTERTISMRQNTGKRRIVDENSACFPELWNGDPGPAYAITKLATEKLCMMYYYQCGMPVTVFRIEYIFQNVEDLEDYANIHVDDVVNAFLLAMQNDAAYGQVFNIAYPQSYMSVKKAHRMLGWKPSKSEEIRKHSKRFKG